MTNNNILLTYAKLCGIPFIDARTPMDTFTVKLDGSLGTISDDGTCLTLPDGSVIKAELITDARNITVVDWTDNLRKQDEEKRNE